MAVSLDFPGMKQCRDCTLSLNRLRVVPGFGAVPSKVMFLAQSPGRVEDARGIPLVGPSGQLLAEAELLGILREEVVQADLQALLRDLRVQGRLVLEEDLDAFLLDHL